MLALSCTPVRRVEMALLVQRVADALDHAAVDLAFDQLRIDRPAAVVNRDDALDLDDAGFGVDRDLRELHAADAVPADVQVAELARDSRRSLRGGRRDARSRRSSLS